jgi:hypothetical protein
MSDEANPAYVPGPNATFVPVLKGDELIAKVQDWAAQNQAAAAALSVTIQGKIQSGADWGEIIQIITTAIGLGVVFMPK